MSSAKESYDSWLEIYTVYKFVKMVLML